VPVSLSLSPSVDDASATTLNKLSFELKKHDDCSSLMEA
jgi:hypothetical protein